MIESLDMKYEIVKYITDNNHVINDTVNNRCHFCSKKCTNDRNLAFF